MTTIGEILGDVSFGHSSVITHSVDSTVMIASTQWACVKRLPHKLIFTRRELDRFNSNRVTDTFLKMK